VPKICREVIGWLWELQEPPEPTADNPFASLIRRNRAKARTASHRRRSRPTWSRVEVEGTIQAAITWWLNIRSRRLSLRSDGTMWRVVERGGGAWYAIGRSLAAAIAGEPQAPRCAWCNDPIHRQRDRTEARRPCENPICRRRRDAESKRRWRERQRHPRSAAR
jgi:hypothetical protein